jgi:RNA polymerase sigma factor (sigma-70 family)
VAVVASASKRSGPTGALTRGNVDAMAVHHYRELLGHFTHAMRDRDAAADIVQEAYLRLLALQKKGQAVVDVRALLYRVAHNLVVDRHRRAEVRSHDDIHSLPEAQHPVVAAHLQPEEALCGLQTARAYERTIAALPPRCRQAFILHVFDGLSHAQVAQQMNISISMVEKHVARGLLECRSCERALRGTKPLPGASTPK